LVQSVPKQAAMSPGSKVTLQRSTSGIRWGTPLPIPGLVARNRCFLLNAGARGGTAAVREPVVQLDPTATPPHSCGRRCSLRVLLSVPACSDAVGSEIHGVDEAMRRRTRGP